MLDMYQGETYAENNPTWHEEDAPWKARHIQTMIHKHRLPTGRICEVGCGTGEILLNLEQAFPEAELVGYEISPHAYGRAKQKETGRTHFHFADVTMEEAPRFDILLMIDVFEHVDNYMAFLKSMRDVAAYKIFHIPLDLSVQSVFRSWPISKLRKDVGHIHYFYKDTAIAALEDCGYRIIDHHYTKSRSELPNQALSSQLMRLPRQAAFKVSPDWAARVLGGYSLLVLAE
jgi:ubiquinone/menaquinone biosynthesis C-methylase UbiE